MLKYILVLLDPQAASFCYYDRQHNVDKNGQMSDSTLARIVEYANELNYPLYFLFPETGLDRQKETLIQKATHYRFIPAALEDNRENNILVIENESGIESLTDSSSRNLILRIARDEIGRITEYVLKCIGKCKRINLHLRSLEDYTDADIKTYRVQLDRITSIIIAEYSRGNAIELNFLSDRILLKSMNNCNAGIDHVTYAPNGKFYICPGFYYDDENDSIGDIEHGIEIKNKEMLDIAKAPICSICDAFHCKRCIYLNRKTTQEINTPSYQQCLISHYERNEGKRLLDTLRRTPGFHDFDGLPQIPKINYIDPYRVLIGDLEKPGEIIPDASQSKIAEKDSKNNLTKNVAHILKVLSDEELTDISSKDLLIEIYKLIRMILKEFNK